jgi:lipopolysaccharide export system permease protein
MAANLVPHYLGLALPTAFTAGIFVAIARLGDDNEIDVMLSTGRSIARLAMPYVALALILSLFNLYLFGFLQPLSRYGYHVAVHYALHSGWDARVEDKRFIAAARGFTLSADAVDSDGRGLRGVFIERRKDGAEEITTAPHGRLVPSPDGSRLTLELEAGLVVRQSPGSGLSSMRFRRGLLNYDFSPVPPPFRPRGESVRELTLPELWRGIRESAATQPKRVLAAELHGRLARIVLVLVLPLLAVPLGMASKRGRRAPGVVFAVIAILAINHSLQFGESLAESGRAAALPAVWIPFVIFGAVCIWLFRYSQMWPGDNPIPRGVTAIEGAFEGLGRRVRSGRQR